MTHSERPAHVMNPPILEAEEIPYEPADMQSGPFLMEIEFNREEIERLKARKSRGSEPLGRFIKRAALETADREAKAKSGDGLHAAD